MEDFSKGVKGNNKLTYKDKKNIVSMVVEKIEIEDKGNKRIVRPFFRFDQKAIAHAIPSGRTDLVDHKAQKGVLNKRNPVGGGR